MRPRHDRNKLSIHGLLAITGLMVATAMAVPSPVAAESDPPTAQAASSGGFGDFGAPIDLFDRETSVSSWKHDTNATGTRIIAMYDVEDRLRVATKGASSSSWSSFETVFTAATTNLASFDVAIQNDGDAAVTWIWSGDSRYVTARYYTASTGTWSPEVTVATETGAASGVGMAALSDGYVIGYRAARSRVEAVGLKWTPGVAAPAPTLLSGDIAGPPGGAVTFGAIQVESDRDSRGIVLWSQNVAPFDKARASVLTGATWSAAETISSNADSSASVVLSTFQTGFGVGLRETTGGISSVYLRGYTFSTGTWAALSSVVATTTATSAPGLWLISGLATSSGFVVYLDRSGSNNVLMAKPLSNLSAVGVALSDTSTSVNNLSVSVGQSTSGQAVVVWRTTGSNAPAWSVTIPAGASVVPSAVARVGTASESIDATSVLAGGNVVSIVVRATSSAVYGLAESTWSGGAPSTLSFLTPHSSPFVMAMDSVTDGDGNGLLVWTESFPARIVYATKSPAATSWSEPTVLDSGGEAYGNVLLESDVSGRSILVYYDTTAATMKYRFHSRSAGWSSATSFGPSAGAAKCLSGAVNEAGRGVLVYATADEASLYFVSVDTGTRTVSSPTLLRTASYAPFYCGSNVGMVAVGVDSANRFVTAFEEKEATVNANEVWSVVGTAGSTVTGTPTRLSPASDTVVSYNSPVVRVGEDGRVAVVWSRYDGNTNEESISIRVGTITGGFGPAVDFDPSPGTTETIYSVSLVFQSSGQVVGSFRASTSGPEYETQAFVLPAGASTISSTVIESSEGSIAPLLGQHGDEVVLISFDGDSREVRRRTLAAGSTTWSAAEVLGTDTEDFLGVPYPVLSINGEAEMVAWHRYNNQSHFLLQTVNRVPDLFIPLASPKRLMDTRGGGRFGTTSSGGVSVRRLQVAGATATDGSASGLPASGIGAVALNVTAVDGRDDRGYGFVTVYPCDSVSTAVPNSSNLNFAGGQTIPNAVIAPVSADGHVCFSVYGNSDLLVDVAGYFPSISGFTSLASPKRLMDTRGGGRFGTTSSGGVSVRRLQVAGATATDGSASGLPSSGIGAVALNVTAVDGRDDRGYGFVTVYPCDSVSTAVPNSSNLNFAGGQTIPNAVIAPVSADGHVCFSVYGNSDLLVDVAGYVTTGSGFSSLASPKRLMDTRGGGRFGTTSSGGVSVRRLQVAGATATDGSASGLPSSGIGAVALNVTAVDGRDDRGYGFVTVYPCDSVSTAVPNSSNLNFAGGQTIPNAVIAPVSADGHVCFSVYGNSDLLVDVAGWM